MPEGKYTIHSDGESSEGCFARRWRLRAWVSALTEGQTGVGLFEMKIKDRFAVSAGMQHYSSSASEPVTMFCHSAVSGQGTGQPS